MLKNKRIWFSSLALIALLAPTALNQISVQNPVGTRADGTAPPAPPIPIGMNNEQTLNADGTAPPAPPIPLHYSSNNV